MSLAACRAARPARVQVHTTPAHLPLQVRFFGTQGEKERRSLLPRGGRRACAHLQLVPRTNTTCAATSHAEMLRSMHTFCTQEHAEPHAMHAHARSMMWPMLAQVR